MKFKDVMKTWIGQGLILVPVLCMLSFMGMAQSDTSHSGFFSTHEVKDILYSGRFVLETQYGLLPYSRNVDPPQSNTVLSGAVGVSLGKVPVKMAFHYSSLGLVSGINNYFRMSFDASQYKKNMRDYKFEKSGVNEKKIDSLFEIKTATNKSLAFLKYQISLDSLKSKGMKEQIFKEDSILTFDTPNTEIAGVDSLKNKRELLEKNLKHVDQLIDGYRKMDALNHEGIKVDTTRKKFGASVLESLQVLEFGLCNPNYSEFLIARSPVSGVNGEMQINNLFVGFTHGTTLSNFRDLTNQGVENQANQNSVLSVLGFPENPEGNRVTSMKVGPGTKSTTHLFVGGLYGVEKENGEDQRNFVTAHNYVLEVDGKWTYVKNHSISLIYAKSYMKEVLTEGGDKTALPEKVNDGIRSNALYAETSGKFLKWKNTYSASIKLVDPFYKSFGVGFMQSDNITVRGKLTQQLSKKVKVQGSFRVREDDLLGYNGIKNNLTSYTIGGSYKPVRGFLIKINYNPFELKSVSEEQVLYHTKNEIFNLISSYTKRKGKKTTTITGMWMHYQLDRGVYISSMDNFTLSWNQSVTKNFRLTMSGSGFSGGTAVSRSQEVLLDLKSTWKKERSLIALGIKSMFNFSTHNWDYGASVQGDYKFNKVFSLVLKMEKVLLGSFYENIGGQNIIGNGYRATGGIQMRW